MELRPHVKMRTPWGDAQNVERLVDGIYFVGTASHGGVWLSDDRMKAAPQYWRHRWYEEDCDCNIPFMLFKEELLKDGPDWLKRGLLEHPPEKGVADHYPDEYERHFKVKLRLEDSRTLRDREFDRLNADKWIAVTAWGQWHKDVPEGMVGVRALLGGRRGKPGEVEQDKYFLVPADEYRSRPPQGFVVDPARHETIQPIG